MKAKRFLSLMLTAALVFALMPVTALAAGDAFIVTGNAIGYTYNSGGALTFTQPGTYEVSMAGGAWFTMTDRIVVNAPASSASAPVCITLNNVNIDLFGNSPAFSIQGTSFVDLTLVGISALKSEDDYHAGLHLPDGAALTIDGEGTLWATGSDSGAGIGSGEDGNGGTVTIAGGTVVATGGAAALQSYGGAGIGGGRDGNGGTVTITGGTVTADGGAGTSFGGAGIGGSGNGNGGTVYISGGSVKAMGDKYSEAIGKGEYGTDSGTLMNRPASEGGVPVYLTTVRLAGVSAAAAVNSLTASLGGAPYAYGINNMFTDEDGYLYLYLPASAIVSVVETASHRYIGSITTTASPAASGTLEVDLSSEARLSGLAVNPGTLSPTFASGTYAYTAPVSNDVSNISITAAKINPNATMTLQKGGGAAVTWDGTASTQSLDVGANVFTISVTAQDGTTIRTYTVTVTRAASSDATLSALDITGATLNESFSPGTYAYTASVANSVASVSLAAARNQANAAMTLKKGGGTAMAWDGTASTQSLDVGANVFTIAVTAQDGTTIRTYTVTVTRAASSDAMLSALTVTGATLNESFSPGTYAYTASVANSVSSLSVTPTVSDSNASVTVNGAPVTSGMASGNIDFAVGTNTVTIVVTAQDGTTQTYAIVVTRAGSSDATLSALDITGAMLNESFLPGTYAYTASVDNSAESISLAATRNQANATLTLRKGSGAAAAWDGAASTQSLGVGANVFTIAVTAEDGMTTQAYTVTVTRAASSNAALSGLLISSGAFAPAFTGDTYAYTASVDNSVSSASVTPTVSDSSASVTVNGALVTSGMASGNIDLAVGMNTITIVVTAQDGTTQTYSIVVTRAWAGGGSQPSYINQSMTDNATGVTVSGRIHRRAVLTIKDMALHSEGTCAACDAIREAQKNNQFILGFDIDLTPGFSGPLTVSIPIGNRHNGQIVTILHCVNGRLETLTATVMNGKATFTVTELSPFAVTTGLLVPDSIVTDPPKTGDGSFNLVGLLLCGASAAGLAALIVLGKRRKPYQR